MQEISCPPFFIYKKILISTLVFFISVTSLEGYAASNLEESNNNTFSASGNTSESFQYPSLSNIIKVHLPTLSKAKVSFPGASDREIAVAGPTISLIGNVQPRELILRNSESSLFAFPSFFSLQVSRYKMPRLAEIELLPIKKYASFALGTNTVQAAEELSDKNAALPFLDRLSLSVYCAFAPRGEIIDSRRCDYQALVSGRLDSVPDLATNENSSPEEELPTPTEVATTTPPTPSSSSPIYLTRYITQYIGVPGPRGEDGTDGKDGVDGISSSIPQGYGSYIIPSYSSPSTSIGVSTISYLRQTTIELPVITGGTATNLSLITPTVSGGVFSGLSLFNDSANFTGSVNINNLTATSSTVTNLTSTNATTTDLFSTNGTFTNLFATNATTTNAYIDFLTVGSSTAGSLTLSGTLNVAGTSTLATTTASSFTANYATTTNLFTQNLSVGNASTTGNQSIDGQFTVSGTSTLGANVFLNGSVVVGTSSDELFTVNALVNSNITPSQNITYDLGSPSFYWRNLYANNINVNTISAASTTISGTSNNDFIVNSDNGSSDAEDASFVFFRGLSTPNALLRWNATTKRIESNMSFKVQNETPTTGTTTLTVQSGAGQGSTNLFELLNYAGTKLSAFTKDGWLGIGTTTPVTSLHLATNDGLIIPAGTTAERPVTTLPGIIRYNTTNTGFEGWNGSTWGSLGGVSDADQNTYISAENSAGSNNDELKFYTGGTLRGIFSSTGNFGVGTSTPSGTLAVSSTNSSNFPALYVSGSANTGISPAYGIFSEMRDGGAGSASVYGIYSRVLDNQTNYGVYSDVIGSGETNYGIYSNVANGSVNYSGIFMGGNFGIGTTTPQSALSLGSGQISVPVGSAASPAYSFNENLNTGIYSDVADAVAISAGGNVMLSIRNGTTYSKTLQPYTGATYDLGSAGNFWRKAYVNGLSVNYSSTPTDSQIVIGGSGGVAKVVLDAGTDANSYFNSGGNVGIGTSTPVSRFTVVGTSTLFGSSTSPTALHVIGNIDNTATSTFAPRLISSPSTGAAPFSVFVSGRYAYTANVNGATMSIIDISNPTSPVTVATANTEGGPRSVHVSGRYAYVANSTSNTMSIIDISNPASPVTVATSSTGAAPYSVYVSGRYAYTANHSSSTMSIIDISNPASPVTVATSSVGTNPRSVFVSGRYAYVANYGSSTMSIIDISNPISPTNVATLSISNGPASVFVSGRYAYTANIDGNSMSIIDISNPASPAVTATLAPGGSPQAVFVSGRYAYVANFGSSVSIIDVSSSTAPVTVATATVGSVPRSVFVSGRYVYVAKQDSTMSILDIGGIESTSAVIHSLTAGNLSVNNDIFANGNIVANGGLTIANGFQSQANSSVSGSLNVGTPNSVPQLRLSQTSSVYADLTLDSGGNLTFSTTGYNVKAMSNNLYICDNAGCPGFTATSTAGNIFVENATVFGNNFSINQTSSTSLGMFDHNGSLIMTFDEAP